MYKVQADAIGCQKPAVLMSCYIKFWHLRHENVVDSARQMTETVNWLPEILHSVLQFDRSTNRLIFLALPLIFATTNACRFVWKTLQVKIKWNKKWISQSVHQFLHLKLKIWLYFQSTSHKNGLSPSNWSLLGFFFYIYSAEIMFILKDSWLNKLTATSRPSCLYNRGCINVLERSAGFNSFLTDASVTLEYDMEYIRGRDAFSK